MGKPNTSRPIDKDRLQSKLYEKRKSLAELSLEMGHNKTYLTSYINKGVLTRTTIAYLEKVLGIRYEEYAPLPEVEVVESVVPALPNPDKAETFADYKDDLYKVVYAAVYAAVKRALAE